MWWIFFGGLIGYAVSYLHALIAEFILLVFRVKTASIYVNPKSFSYVRILQSSWGLSRRWMFREGSTFYYGLFISFRYMAVGYVERIEFTSYCLHVWGVSDYRLRLLMAPDTTAPYIAVRCAPSNNAICIRVPPAMRKWQSDVMDAINGFINTSSKRSPCVVCLLTGPSGCGKTTLGKLLHRAIRSGGDLIMVEPSSIGQVGSELGAWTVTRAVILIDEVDVAFRGMMNETKLYPVDKAKYNTWLDMMHEGEQGHTIIMTTNYSYSELVGILGKHADSMLREGRIDMVIDIQKDASGEFIPVNVARA